MDLYKYLKRSKVIWEGNLDYHPKLTSGNHSNIYINCNKVLESYNLALMLIREFDSELINSLLQNTKTVCGLQTGGALLLYILPAVFSKFSAVKLVFTDKHENHKITRSKLEAPILIVDDVISTGSSIAKLLSHYDHKLFNKNILCLINRTGSDSITINGTEFAIISALKVDAEVWEESECPLCQQGSLPIKPKKEWDKLV